VLTLAPAPDAPRPVPAVLLPAASSMLPEGTPPPPPPPATAPPEDAPVFMEAARAAWTYVDRQYQPATGLVNSIAGYPYSTIWDVASGIGATYSARELGLLGDAEYDRRMRRVLQTLQTMRLYEGVAFNKNYSTRTGRPAGRDDRDRAATENGYGWSATDMGRLLIWLRIIADHDPRYAPAADSIVKRLDFSRMVGDGYLWGEDISPRGRKRRYPEGMIPYEQYAAAGFALWGHRAERALSLTENAAPVEVLGVPLVIDRRGHGRLTSEPLVLMGLELGWDPQMRRLSAAALAVQEARWKETGQVTVVSEDAIPRPPYWFYYYTIHSHGRPFNIDAQGRQTGLNGPRWVSAKAAYAWHALLPDDYTRRTLATVAPARSDARGWGSGVYERTGRPTGAENINTAAVILQAALFHARGGRPLIERAAPSVVPVPAPATPTTTPR
jgi:hypothetical protein